MYGDASESKSEIISDYKNIPLIYMWFNKVTGKVYVGSSVNGSKRLSGYYQPSILKKKIVIYNSILKHGHANFSLAILEICSDNSDYEPSKSYILGREAYYLDWALKTYGLGTYNVLNQPGSSLGFKHSLDTLEKLSQMRKGALNPMYNKPKSKEFLEHMNKSIKGEDNPRYGKGKTIYVYNKNHELINSFTSLSAAMEGLNTHNYTINAYLDTGKLFKDTYYLCLSKREI